MSRVIQVETRLYKVATSVALRGHTVTAALDVLILA